MIYLNSKQRKTDLQMFPNSHILLTLKFVISMVLCKAGFLHKWSYQTNKQKNYFPEL